MAVRRRRRRLVVVRSGADGARLVRAARRLADSPERRRSADRSRVHADAEYTHSARTAVLGSLPISLHLSLFSPAGPCPLFVPCAAAGDLSFPLPLDSPIPLTSSLARSLVRSKAVSQRRSAAREIPRTRYEFTFLLLYSTLACPPFCLLEPLVYLADLRLPYVSAAQLSHRSHSLPPSPPPLFLYLPLAFSACICA